MRKFQQPGRNPEDLYMSFYMVSPFPMSRGPVWPPKGMAIRGHVSGGDPRSGEDERQRTFRRPPATGRRHLILVLISAFRRLRSGILLGNCFVVGVRVCARKSDSSAQVLRNSRPEFRLLALLAVDVFIFPSVFSMMARMVILYSENVLDGTKSVC